MKLNLRADSLSLSHARCAEDERSESEGRFGEAEPRRGAQASACAKCAKFLEAVSSYYYFANFADLA